MATGIVHPFTIRLFGPLEVVCQGKPLPPLRSQKGKWLLALLALRHGKEVQRSWLSETLWPDSDHEKALASLSQSLFDLKRALGEEKTRLLSPTSRTLCLDLKDAKVDVVTFDRAISKGKPADLEVAVALYRGPFLEDCRESWTHAERKTRQKDYLQSLETLSVNALTDGAVEKAVEYLERAIAVDLSQQKAHRMLMQILANTGDLNGALKIYHTLRNRLHDDYNEEPHPDTTDLYQQLRKNTVHSKDRPKPPPTHLPASNRLPVPLTELIGRERDLREITADLLSTRLITLTGPGGVGKTRMATEVALEVVHHYRDGVWFVHLESLTNPVLIPQTVAAVIGAKSARGNPWEEALKEFLCFRQALLILDNCEHLIEGCAQLARTLLRECPNLHLLATSRERLGLTGELKKEILPLPVPSLKSGTKGPGRALEPDYHQNSPSMRLFCDRAVAIRPDFALSARNVEEIATICRRLDGIPLALELAAALMETLSEREIAHRLDDRFRLLVAGDRTVEKRHQSLQAALDWSYDLLSEQERILLGRLCVFAGGGTFSAVETVCSGGPIKQQEILPLLSRLVAKSLVVAEERDGNRRYRLLETIREFARTLPNASPAESAALRQAHGTYFLDLAETAEPMLIGAEQSEWLDRLERENDNLREALTWSIETKGHTEEALRLTGALCNFWNARSYHREGQEWLERALNEPKAGKAPVRLKALIGAGNLAYLQDDFAQARLHFEAHRALAEEGGDIRLQAIALASLANVEAGEKDFPRARAYFEKSLELFQTLQDQRSIGLTLANLAIVSCGEKNYAEARGLHDRSLAIFRELKSLYNVALELNNIIYTQFCLEEYGEIPKLLEEVLTLSQTLDNKRVLAHGLTNCFSLAVRLGQMPRASVILGAHEALREEILFPLPEKALTTYRQECELVRSALGSVVYEATYERGRTMSPSQLFAFLHTPDTETDF